ncbi:MAG TPA: PilZ domain-containing protein [Polyangia bacterium]|nr:PilZ domain-containing protein [Polyangia bacterium]
MADDARQRPTLTTDEVRAFIDRAPRCKVRIHVLYQPPGQDATVETQLVNLSTSGMFLAAHGTLLEIGATVEFQFSLDDELVVMKGTAEVARIVHTGSERGMGLRFVALDAESRSLVDRIVDVNSRDPAPVPVEEEPTSRQQLPGGRAVEYGHGTVRIVLSSATAAYFTYNPLMHIGIGGCFIPAEADVPLGTGYQLDIVDVGGHLVLRCKGKVAAKQERRIGVRFVDLDRPSLMRLRAEIAKLGPPPTSAPAR